MLLEGMGPASDVYTAVGMAVILRGGGGVVGLVHCSFWLHPVSDEGQWRQIWDAAYDNSDRENNLEFLQLRFIWCLCHIGQG